MDHGVAIRADGDEILGRIRSSFALAVAERTQVVDLDEALAKPAVDRAEIRLADQARMTLRLDALAPQAFSPFGDRPLVEDLRALDAGPRLARRSTWRVTRRVPAQGDHRIKDLLPQAPVEEPIWLSSSGCGDVVPAGIRFFP